MTRLQDLYEIGGQSPWLDNLRRDWLQDGTMADFLAKGGTLVAEPGIRSIRLRGEEVIHAEFQPLPGADVVLTIAPSAATLRTKSDSAGNYRITITNGTGEYTIPFLAPGSYVVTVTSAGFKSFDRTDVLIVIGPRGEQHSGEDERDAGNRRNDRTREAAMTGNFELFKTTPHYDGTAANPKWLG